MHNHNCSSDSVAMDRSADGVPTRPQDGGWATPEANTNRSPIMTHVSEITVGDAACKQAAPKLRRGQTPLTTFIGSDHCPESSDGGTADALKWANPSGHAASGRNAQRLGNRGGATFHI